MTVGAGERFGTSRLDDKWLFTATYLHLMLSTHTALMYTMLY